MIDLHIHTTYSDGSLTPCEIVALSKKIGLKAIAITDHDTVDGVEEALECGQRHELDVVPGVELSIEEDFEIHILGLFIEHRDEQLKGILKEIKEGRRIRNKQIVSKLREQGLLVSFEDIAKLAGTEDFGRPHIARELLKKGYVRSIKEAFEKYLKFNGSAFVRRKKLSSKDAIKAIKHAHGLAFLAHPIDIKLDEPELLKFIENLITYGLDGIEAYYSKHSKSKQEYYLSIARRYGLLVTGGSDFHGESKPNLKLGEGYGTLSIPDDVYFNLLRHRPQQN